jgi:broad-specificity NMP kinase
MRQEDEDQRQADQMLLSIVEGTAAVTGDNFFASLVRHLAAALILNLHPNTLRSRMKKLGIQRSHYTVTQPTEGGKKLQ